MNDAPKLLVEWSSPWQEFQTALRPAFSRSAKPLAGEARTQLFPFRGMLVSWLCEAALLVVVIVLPEKLASMRPYAPPPIPKYDVIYFSGDELPRTEDLGGAQTGKSGRAGGQEARHRTQAIRVARGESVRDTVVDAPKLKLPESTSAVANLLAFAGKLIPGPAPTEGLKSSFRNAPNVDGAAVAPAPQVARDRVNPAPALVAQVVPPPATVKEDFRPVELPGSRPITVVPPPVSAPERVTIPNPKLTLPAEMVVAPPPQVTRKLAALGPGYGPGRLRSQVVPPPAQVTGTVTDRHNGVSGFGDPSVVTPPAQISASAVTSRGGFPGIGTPSVVAPPAQVSGTGTDRSGMGGLGTPDVVAPPVQVAGSASSRGGFGSLGSANVVPPPPAIASATGIGGHGHGVRGGGSGGPLDIGDVAAPPKSGGGAGKGNGIVVSNRPGSAVGVPGKGGNGSLAMSPNGGDKPGIGGSGGGSGIGRGNGPGSGLSGEGSGAAKQGTGRGADLMAKGGISPYPGPGGAGSGTSGSPAVPGVSVRGGSNIITLPSFEGGGDVSNPERTRTNEDRRMPGITVVATSRSGGALNLYGMLKGDKVYTIYIDTSLGTAVMQFADPTSAAHPSANDLTAPEPMRADLPAGLKPSRLVIACVLDQSGVLKNPHVLEGGRGLMASKVLAALPNWKFRPVLRGNEPIEVNAILGFAIDTSN